MKKYILLIFFSINAVIAFSQQTSNNTLFEWNKTYFNPAYTGVTNTTDINLISRQQWVGFQDAPKTQYISSHAYLPAGIGIGGAVFNSVTGPTRQTGIKAAFAKQININREIKLSMALGLDIYQNAYDQTRLNTGLPADPAIVSSPIEQKLAPDASVGFVLFTNEYFVGLSSTNLLQSKYDFLSTISDFSNPIKRTFYLNGGYSFRINNQTRYVPGVMLKKTIGLPLQMDISNRLYYNFMIAGLSYRTNKDASLILGLSFAQIYEIVYAYDYSFNPLKTYSHGSHEVMLRFKIPNYNRGNRRGGVSDEILWAL